MTTRERHGGGSNQQRTRRRRRRREPARLIIRRSREVNNQTRIVVGAIAAFVLLILLGFNIEALIAIGALVVFVALIFLLVRGPTPLFEIVTDEDEEIRAEHPSQIEEDQSLPILESIPGIDEQPSDDLQKALGPLATELHDLERQLLEEVANGRFAADEVARLAQELAQNRTELIEKGTAAADGSATGQPPSSQSGR
jgi:hypothetical protein